MKTAFELAMERFGGPLKQYTDEEKARLAEVDAVYEAQIVQAKFAAESRCAKAESTDELKKIQEELTSEIASIQNKRDRKKQELKDSFGK